MPDFVHGSERRPLVPGQSLFDVAGELSVVVPASCKMTGRCHECVVEIRSGADQLTPPTAEEGFLGASFRLACQARVATTEHDVEFSVLRRRLRILLAPEDLASEPDLDPAVREVDGRVIADEGPIWG